jgi:hypothetical protein
MGICFLIACASEFFNTQRLIGGKLKTEASIVSITMESYGSTKLYEVFVEYEVDNRRYTNQLNTYSSNMDEGDTVPIRYSPENPNFIAYAKNEFLSFWIFLVLGIIASAISVNAFKAYRRIQKEQMVNPKGKK